MKVTYNWLKDFVEIKITPQALADKLTMAGLEVTSLQERDGDSVFEIEVTSNRPDCLNVIGIAREVAAITGKKLKLGSRLAVRGLREHRTPNTEHRNFRILIEDKKDCPLYTAKVIQDVKVGPSPAWLAKRLELIGCRSINNIVDATNYTLFNYGQPLHAFDLDKIKPPAVVVRRARENEKITTIDGEHKTLNKDILVIADQEKIAAVAGVIGGKDSEVTEKTRNILLEAAVFDPVTVRKGRRQLGLESESAYRFERGVSLESVEIASSQAVRLIQETAGGKLVFASSRGIAKSKKRKITLSADSAQKILGVNIAPSKIKAILKSLGFKLFRGTNADLVVEVPAYRPDINLEIDLIEEVARIFGYAKIPVSLPAIQSSLTFCQPEDLAATIKNILIGLGLNEVITYGLIDRDSVNKLNPGLGDLALEVLNPLSREQEILRPTLLPSLIKCLAYNLNQKEEHAYIFEIAKSFRLSSPHPLEELTLGILLCGEKPLFLKDMVVKDIATILHLKGVLEKLFAHLGVRDYIFRPDPADSSKVSIFLSQDKIGEIIIPLEEVLGKFQIKDKEVFALELSLEKLKGFIRLEKKFIPAAKYPAIVRDISFILKEDVLVGEVLAAIEEKGRPLLRQLKIADYYRGKQIPSGYRGLTISCVYRLDERTLLEAEVSPAQNLILGMLGERFGAKLR